jgi:RNA polymerase sigma factor (sigma-70 family)
MDYLRERPELLERLRKGDKAAVAELYREYGPVLHEDLKSGYVIPSTGMRVPPVRDADHRADLVHDVFVIVLRPKTLLTYDGTRDFRPLLRRIARNELIDYHRRHGKELLAGRKPLVDEEVLPAPPEPEAEHGWQEPKAIEMVTKYAAALPAPMRAIFDTLYDGDGRVSERKAMKQLGLSRSKLRRLRDRMRRELRAILEQAGIRDSNVTPEAEDEEDDDDG